MRCLLTFIFLKRCSVQLTKPNWIKILKKKELKKYLISAPKLWLVKLKNIFNAVLYTKNIIKQMFKKNKNDFLLLLSVFMWRSAIKFKRRRRLRNSEGSQSHQPPHEPSCWAHHEPKKIVKERVQRRRISSLKKNFLFWLIAKRITNLIMTNWNRYGCTLFNELRSRRLIILLLSKTFVIKDCSFSPKIRRFLRTINAVRALKDFVNKKRRVKSKMFK